MLGEARQQFARPTISTRVVQANIIHGSQAQLVRISQAADTAIIHGVSTDVNLARSGVPTWRAKARVGVLTPFSYKCTAATRADRSPVGKGFALSTIHAFFTL